MTDVAKCLDAQRLFFQSGATRELAWRRDCLQRLRAALHSFESQLFAALHHDLGRSDFQSCASETGFLHNEIDCALAHLNSWIRGKNGRVSFMTFPSSARIQPEPFGVALILGPWNYPLQLLLAPLVSAIAAGNCAMLKPSELAPATETVVREMIASCFDPKEVAVSCGGPDVAQALLDLKYDKIFFTGSTPVGKLVMTAAAKHLTPVTLELGGKCPAIVCADADVKLAARRIAWGKFLNAGQICVAPDFVLVDAKIHHAFNRAVIDSLLQFYGDDPKQAPDFGRIINDRHFERLLSYLNCGGVLHGGQHDRASRFLAPTIMEPNNWETPLMQEEIFGPILPILPFRALEDVFENLRNQPTPLAAYFFTNCSKVTKQLLSQIRSGGAAINDTVSHMISPGLPFGGLGESGLGSYHGIAGFNAFSHHRTVFRRSTMLDLPFRYPPQKISVSLLKRALPWLLGK